MDAGPSAPGKNGRTGKRKHISDHERRRKRPRNSSATVAGSGPAAEGCQRGKNILDLPLELLTEIFAFSANDAFPATCRYLYDALYANPKHNDPIKGPPMWLQKRFVENTNPTISFAVQKCLRRRFFGADTFKLFLQALLRTNSLCKISVPLRCVIRGHSHTRELLLCTELFINDVTLTSKSSNKALVQIAAHQARVDSDALFWRMTKSISFARSSVFQAFKVSAKKHAFDDHGGTFHYLVERFGIDDTIGHELYDLALSTQDSQLIAVLQEHGVKPDMAALTTIMTMMQG